MIRKALEKDIPKIEDLLLQVCLVHHNGRPDIFKVGRKYSEEELKMLLNDEKRPILVCVDENDGVMGYCFCIFQQHGDNSVLTDIKTMYIDDLCVDENLRGKHIGRELYEAAVHTEGGGKTHIQERVCQDTRGMRGKACRTDQNHESGDRGDEKSSEERIRKEGRPRTVAPQKLHRRKQRKAITASSP